MIKAVLKIFDFIKLHRIYGICSALLMVVLLTLSALTLSFKEDISDFLPLDSHYQAALKIYQNISGADKIIAIVKGTPDKKDSIVSAVNTFVETVEESDTSGLVKDITAGVDMDKISEITDFTYANIPYFLQEKDYQHFDSLLAKPDFIAQQLKQDKQSLMFPVGGLLSDNIQRDPLNFFTPVVSHLQQATTTMNYEIYDGCIFSSDMSRAIVMLTSPFGASETEQNGKLLDLLTKSAQKAEKLHTGIKIHFTGGPAIAVGNAKQIKSDSILSIALSVGFILILLFTTLKSFRNILLIALSIAFGWLFALGGLALVHHDVSVIVIGISSVIIGIAVNYPLHLVAHLRHTPEIRNALKEIVAPLVVGNITTVGAFLALVPLESVALRDLGIFSSLLLIGTILFVLVYLPHLVKLNSRKPIPNKTKPQHGWINFLSGITLEKKKWLIITVCILTVILGGFSFKTSFDSNISHINYMTDEQKADMTYFQSMVSPTNATKTLYVVSQAGTLDKALQESGKIQEGLQGLKKEDKIKSLSSCSEFLTAPSEQAERLKRWNTFVKTYRDKLKAAIATEAVKNGFTQDAFDDFFAILDAQYMPQPTNYFHPLTSTTFASNVSIDSLHHQYAIVDQLNVPEKTFDTVKEHIQKTCPTQLTFDVESMNSTIANHLSNDFNYIGIVCGCIVFFFLWLSFGSFELAVISFIPMAVSWVWILGLMGIFDIQFNIVNVILATFIFGQGDDYTIFMTEGVSYEYAYRRKMLASYKHSIILSALIMFIGIGSLITAQHPALRSLAQVTIIGMFTVVLMAGLIPPLIFKWMIMEKGTYRKRPISVRPVLVMCYSVTVYFLQLTYIYIIGFIFFHLLGANRRRKDRFHAIVSRIYRWDLQHIPSVKFCVNSENPEAFRKPSILIANHQSMLDSAIAMALSPRIILIANRNASGNRIIRKVFQWLDFYTIPENEEIDLKVLEKRVQEGYSIFIFPEGERNPESSILRFHKGAFKLSQQLQLNITPVLIHGTNNVLPRNSISVYPGSINVCVKPDISYASTVNYSDLTRLTHKYYIEQYRLFASQIETASYFKPYVLDCFRYKGVDIFAEVKRCIRKNMCYTKLVDRSVPYKNIHIYNSGLGIFAIFMALVHKDAEIYAYETDIDKYTIALHSGEHIRNLHIIGDNSAAKNAHTNTEDAVFYVYENGGWQLTLQTTLPDAHVEKV